MAIRIPILTSFDSKGLKQANASFAKLSGSVNSLGRNFATAGIAVGAIGAGLAKTVQTASNYTESVNAVNVAFGKSAQGIIDFGKTAATTLGVSQVDFNNAAVRFSAFAERIVGSGGDASKFIAEISTRAADFASVFNIEVSEALQVFQSGLAGEAEPLKRFGINLLDTEVKAYAVRTSLIKQGETMTEQQKVIARYGLLMESTAKTSGDFANTSDGLANQMRILKAEVSNTQIEIGNQLLPVMAELLPVVRDLVSELGTQLVAAVKAVDWKALTTDIMNTLSFIVQNATAIAQLTVAIFAINTAFKAMQVASGLVSVAIEVQKWLVAQLASGMTLATIATNIFSAALRLIPFVAIVAGIASISTELVKAADNFSTFRTRIEEASPSISDLDRDMAALAATFLTFDIKGNPFLQLLQDAIKLTFQLTGALDKIPKEITTTYTLIRQTASQVASSFGGSTFDAQTAMFNAGQIIPTPTAKTGGGSSSSTSSPLGQLLNASNTNKAAIKQAGKLEQAGLSKSVAQWITSVNKPVVAAKEAIKRISNNGQKAIKNLTKAYNNSAAGQAAAASAAASSISESFSVAYDDTADKEAAALAERERVFQSFADAVKNTFAGIKNSILNAFDLTELGGSTNAITRNMEKLLVRLRAFATNVSQLSSMGLNPALLQQVITAGPLAGARLAETLVMGGASALGALNAGYSEFGALSSQIAQTGTESLFNREAQQTVYNISVDGGVGSGSTIGKAIVDAIKAYERTSGAVWQGA
jgi:hypothetical protein